MSWWSAPSIHPGSTGLRTPGRGLGPSSGEQTFTICAVEGSAREVRPQLADRYVEFVDHLVEATNGLWLGCFRQDCGDVESSGVEPLNHTVVQLPGGVVTPTYSRRRGRRYC